MKLLASAFEPGGPLFVAYSCIAVGAALTVARFVDDVSGDTTPPPPFAESATAALRLFRRSALCRLLVPTNLCFGLAAAYLNGSFLSAVVAAGMGEWLCTNQSVSRVHDAAVLAPSSGEEPASPRHRAGAASIAWSRRERRRREILIYAQASGR